MLPLRIGRYDVSAELGRGATSIVYKGVDPATRRVVAIKTLQRSGDADDGEVDSILLRFRNEARAIGRLHHPGIVAIDEFGEDGLHSWIAMEHVEGSNLDDVLLRTPLLGQERALAVMDELLDALGCVHREGICHRDVKPANIMLTTAGRVKLTDFGTARLRDLGLTRVSAVIGTPAFMAPEQFTGGALDHRADLFACGVLLFLLLSGRRPFAGAPAAVMHQILHEEPPLLSAASGRSIGRAFDAVVAQALAKRADERFASAEDMRAALRAAAAQSAEATLATVVATMVQDAGQPWGSLAGLVQSMSSESRAAVDPVLASRAGLVAPLDLSGARRQVALVDALALYVPDAERPETLFDGPLPAAAEAVSAPDAAAAAREPFLPPAVLGAAQHVMTRLLGPVASVIVRRAAVTADGSRPAFLAHLLAEVPAAQRDAFRAELEALL
jgi:tRNA A-37 threonylcarbamoyl transferase component Bud32